MYTLHVYMCTLYTLHVLTESVLYHLQHVGEGHTTRDLYCTLQYTVSPSALFSMCWEQMYNKRPVHCTWYSEQCTGPLKKVVNQMLQWVVTCNLFYTNMVINLVRLSQKIFTPKKCWIFGKTVFATTQYRGGTILKYNQNH